MSDGVPLAEKRRKMRGKMAKFNPKSPFLSCQVLYGLKPASVPLTELVPTQKLLEPPAAVSQLPQMAGQLANNIITIIIIVIFINNNCPAACWAHAV